MWYIRALTVLLLITPLFTHAAGFAKDSLFLSKTPVTEGETVFIHAVVANEGQTSFEGQVVFKDSDTDLGAVSVEIQPGGAQAVSVSWKPTSGSHHVTAELRGAGSGNGESTGATFVIQAKPVAKESEGGSVESSAKIHEVVASISPQAAAAATPVFAAFDSLREKGVAALAQSEAWTNDKLAPSGEVAGEHTKGLAAMAMGFVAALLGYLFKLLTFILSSAGIFYPVAAFAFLYILWRTFKRIRRPA